ncbi:3-hydroxyacyl-CoA dehydrogenase family protein [Escherichia coli TA206]|uniref:3-hydroxyacyl-CoA dehydrogenase n=1 Tax=Escherichia coli TaxID=562 RepID=UPI0001E8A47B|nr:3-hydroxyacyl-CoA dehydrogenase [Escherichia coli]EGI25749.1 3-hydroxyacyl-CoA dehydrogenase family protein [Escherichia coli TA206]
MRNITVLGAGVLGSQIALQFAAYNNKVTVYDINDKALDNSRNQLTRYYEKFNWINGNKNTEALSFINHTTNIYDAIHDADIVIEAVPEDISIKENLYKKLNNALNDNTILATNSSTFLTSRIGSFVKNKKNFLACHFANNISYRNLVEICKTSETSETAFNELVSLAEESGLVPIILQKEKEGYLLNSMLVPLLEAAASLYINEIGSFEDIDKAWVIGTGAAAGPFRIFDIIGFNTVYNIHRNSANENSVRFADKLKTDYIDKGKLGVQSGEGFYKYE